LLPLSNTQDTNPRPAPLSMQVSSLAHCADGCRHCLDARVTQPSLTPTSVHVTFALRPTVPAHLRSEPTTGVSLTRWVALRVSRFVLGNVPNLVSTLSVGNEGVFALWNGCTPTVIRAMSLNFGQLAFFRSEDSLPMCWLLLTRVAARQKCGCRRWTAFPSPPSPSPLLQSLASSLPSSGELVRVKQ